MKSVVLVAHSLMWPNAARLAIAFRKAGLTVEAIAPKGHPIHKMRSPDRTFVYRSLSPRSSLRHAIEASRPQLIVPCDDRVAEHLLALHAETAKADGRASPYSISAVIESSLGSPRSHELLRQRRFLSTLAALPDVQMPRTDPIRSMRELKDWADAHGLPALLKLDGSTGGQDVLLVRDHRDVAKAFLNMRLRRGGLRQLSAAVQKRDVEPLLGFVRGGPRGVVVQSFVAGQLANCAVACWRGEVLASIAVEVVSSRSNFGVATVVRPVEGSVMKAAARSIVRHLNLSGLCGFDFIIDGVSGQAKLIEINARATQINHMRWGSGLDAAHALGRALGGAMSGVDVEAEPTPAEVLLFPHRPPSDSEGPCFADAGYDLPWEEPELMKFYGAQLSGAARTSIPAASGDAAIDAAESEEPPTSCQIT